MNKGITRFVAKENSNPNYVFTVNASTVDEARNLLTKRGFNGRVYQEEYVLICTTPYIVGKLDLGECDE